MADDYILAIDNGTQSVRALLFDLTGQLVAKTQVPLTAYFSREPGWVEHDAEGYWQALCQACQRLWSETAVAKSTLRGVAVTTQRGTVVNLDENGRPLRPAIVWLDQRRARKIPQIKTGWRAAFALVGVARTIRHFQHEAESNWIAENQPDIWAGTRHYVLLSGYLNHQLCGRWVDSTGSQVGYVPFDFKGRLGRRNGIGNGRRCRSAGQCCRSSCYLGRSWVRSPLRPRQPPAYRPACRSSPPPRTKRAKCSAPAASRRMSAAFPSVPRRRSTPPIRNTSRPAHSFRPTRRRAGCL